MGFEELLSPPKHETNSGSFLLELEDMAGKYPELTIIGISDAVIAKKATEAYGLQTKTGLVEKARRNWNVLRILEASSAEKSVVFACIIGDCLIANIARNEIDELALKNEGSRPSNEPFSSTGIVHFLGYEFRS